MATKLLRWMQLLSPATSLKLCLIVANSLRAQTDYSRFDDSAQRLIAAAKPTAAELRWQQIPWVTDLTAGQRLAKAEGRPIFLWVTGDDPLERC